MRARLALLALLAVAPAPPADTTLYDAALNFDRKWDRFIRALFGCPQDAGIVADSHTCSLARGAVDYRAFRESREAAVKLFRIQER